MEPEEEIEEPDPFEEELEGLDKGEAVDLETAVDGIVAKLPPEERAKHKEVLMSGVLEGKSISSVLGVSDEVIEFFYGEGYKLYMIRKYDESLRFFKLLYLLNPKDSRFSLGMASCYHQQKNYEKATGWYLAAALIDANSPLPYYYLSDCFLKIGEPEMAEGALKIALDRIGDNATYSQLKERITRVVAALEKVSGGTS